MRNLEVANDQNKHLSSNRESPLESKFYKTLNPWAIYADDKPVGFLMGDRSSDAKIGIFRFMIDAEYQNKGLGHTALELSIAEVQQIDGIKQIETCYHPDNKIAKSLNLKIGFQEVGKHESGGDIRAVMSV